MLTSLAKNFNKGRASASAISSAQQKQHSTFDSSNDANIRPVHIIEEDKADRVENRQIDHGNDAFPIAFDEASLSTHGSVYQVPVKTVIICDKEGKVLFGNDAHRDDEDDPSVEENKDGTQKGKKYQHLQTRSHHRDDNIELSFHVDGSVLDGSVLDNALENFKHSTTCPSYSGSKNCNWKQLNYSNKDYEQDNYDDNDDDDSNLLFHKTKRSPDLVQEEVTLSNEYDMNLENSAFAEIGKLMFIQQPDTHNSKSSSSVASSPIHRSDHRRELEKKLFGDKNLDRSTTILKLVMLLKSITAFFTVYGVRAFWFNLTGYTLNAVQGENAYDDICSEESFHFAMYQLSALNVDKKSVEDFSSINSSRLGYFLTATATILTYHIFGYVLNRIWTHFSPNEKAETKMADIHFHHNTMATPKKEPKLVRELNSLDKKKVFASTFVTEVISPDGSISSIKRSSRVKSVCPKIEETCEPIEEVAFVKVNLHSTFKAEPEVKNDGMMMKIKSEKI